MKPRCTLCSGNFGQLNSRNNHNLCEARRNLGSPTPFLGDACDECEGTGYDNSKLGLKVAFLPLNPNGKTLEAFSKVCQCAACGGEGKKLA